MKISESYKKGTFLYFSVKVHKLIIVIAIGKYEVP